MKKELKNFDEDFKKMKQTLVLLLGKEYTEYKDALKMDVEAFMDQSKGKLERWTRLLTEKSINTDEYEWLIKSQKELLTLKELEKAGLSIISMGQMKTKAISTLVDIGKGFLHNF